MGCFGTTVVVNYFHFCNDKMFGVFCVCYEVDDNIVSWSSGESIEWYYMMGVVTQQQRVFE